MNLKTIIPFLLVVFLMACSGDDPEKSNDTELFEYSSNGGESYTTTEPRMLYDSAQLATFLMFDNDDIKMRCNFRGRDVGTYEMLEGIFYKYSYEDDGTQNIDIVCDTYSGIVVNVEKYGEVGEMIEGTFTADNCDGKSRIDFVTGTFRVIREY